MRTKLTTKKTKNTPQSIGWLKLSYIPVAQILIYTCSSNSLAMTSSRTYTCSRKIIKIPNILSGKKSKPNILATQICSMTCFNGLNRYLDTIKYLQSEHNRAKHKILAVKLIESKKIYR